MSRQENLLLIIFRIIFVFLQTFEGNKQGIFPQSTTERKSHNNISRTTINSVDL